MCSNPCGSEVSCFRPESNRGPYGLLNFLSAALSTTELWWRMNHRKSFRTLYPPRYPTAPAEVLARTRTSFKTSGQIQNCPQNIAICTVNFQKCWSFYTDETPKDTRSGHNWRRAAAPVRCHLSSALERGHTARSHLYAQVRPICRALEGWRRTGAAAWRQF